MHRILKRAMARASRRARTPEPPAARGEQGDAAAARDEQEDTAAAAALAALAAAAVSAAGEGQGQASSKAPRAASSARRARGAAEEALALAELLERLDAPEKPNHAFSSGKVIEAREHSLGRPTPGFLQEEGFIDAFYQPRSLSGLVLLVLGVVHVTILHEERLLGPTDRVKSGLLLGCSAFLLYCVIQLRDGHLLRPHPAVWRLVHGMGLLYFVLLVFLLCQDFAGVARFLQLLDSEVGLKHAEHSYGSDCRLYAPELPDPWQNIKDQVLDRFMVAHLLGWMLKALILRDWTLMWIASVLFEVLEVTFQHMYANFNECYWDHLALDVFGCNLAGMALGMWLVQRFATHEFNWSGRKITSIDSAMGKMVRVALQFTPYSFETYRWHVFNSWRQLFIGVAVLFVLLLGEMNAFFLKSTFNIPIKSDINLYRLAFWVPMTYMCVFEFHRYGEGLSRRIGVNSWLATSLVSLETALVVKHAYHQAMFTSAQLRPAEYIINGWLATALLVVLTALVKGVRKVLIWEAGASEVFNNSAARRTQLRMAASDAKASPAQRKAARDQLEAHHRTSVERGKRLDQLFRVLTYAIPVPLLVVLAIDCYRSWYQHPPPTPGQGGW